MLVHNVKRIARNKIALVITLATLGFVLKGAVVNWLTPVAAGPLHSADIVLLSATWCGYCKRMKSFFEKNNIDFVEYDVEKSQIGERLYRYHGGGGVPLVTVDGELVRGYQPRIILKLLSDPA